MQNDATQRQTQMILAGHPRGQAPEDRLLAESPKKTAWLLKQRAMFERLVIEELRSEAKEPDWLRRWVG